MDLVSNKSHHQFFKKLVSLWFLPILILFAGCAENQKDQPNVILVMADDMGCAQTGYYGHPFSDINISIDEKFLSIKKFETGQSNPTYLFSSANKSFVLRSKPFGHLLLGAHRIDREYRVMSALH